MITPPAPTRVARRGERGAVTAELAMALPLLLAVTTGLVWLLAVGSAQVRAVDAARETARAVARGDAVDDAVARGVRVAPDGAQVSVEQGAADVRVVVTGTVDGPAGMFGFLPAVRLHAEAVAAPESVP